MNYSCSICKLVYLPHYLLWMEEEHYKKIFKERLSHGILHEDCIVKFYGEDFRDLFKERCPDGIEKKLQEE